MEEKLIKLLTNIHEAKTLIEINDLMGLKTPEELKELQDTLNKLISEYKVFFTKKEKYILLKNCPSLKIGPLSVNKKGFGFVILSEEDDIYIDKTNLKDAIDEYSKRLSKYCKLNIIELSDEKIPDKLNSSLELSIKEKECNNILNHIKKDSYVIALDLRGKELNSEELSKKIEDISMESSNITFIIGGSLGLTNSVLEKANLKLCFSKMTFPHQLIRIFLLEQIFRAFKISNGETYHR